MASSTTTSYYKDLNYRYSMDSGALVVSNEDDINRQIALLLSTSLGSRPFEPTYGSQVMKLLWDPVDDITAWRLETAVFIAIEKWITEITVDTSNTSITTLDAGNGYSIYVPYTVNVSNSNASFYAEALI